MKKKGKLYIGTSGWQYKHWRGTFYPPGLRNKDEFSYYCERFNSVELNNSFYKLPSSGMFTSWRKSVPRGFLFSVKASRFITHMKKLKLDKAGISIFFERVKILKEKRGPILFQLPPKWKRNEERLAAFTSILPERYRYSFEFRDPTWYTEEIYQLLRERNCAFCIYELAGHLSPVRVTADFVYVRLHGPGDKYQGSYTNRELGKWAGNISEWTKQGKDVYIYFDNDQAGFAAFNAQRLMELCGEQG